MAHAWFEQMDCRVPEFPGNACGTDYFRKIQKHGVITGDASENFNVTAVRPHRDAIYREFNDVDEVLVSYVDK
jgi:hypothetical protein